MELLTDEIIKQALEADGIMEEPDAPWLLEYINTDIEVIHGWGAISHKRHRALPELLNQAKSGHLIILESSMPMRYNLKPTQKLLEEEAQKKGLQIEVQNQTAQWMLVRVYKSATDEL